MPFGSMVLAMARWCQDPVSFLVLLLLHLGYLEVQEDNRRHWRASDDVRIFVANRYHIGMSQLLCALPRGAISPRFIRTFSDRYVVSAHQKSQRDALYMLALFGFSVSAGQRCTMARSYFDLPLSCGLCAFRDKISYKSTLLLLAVAASVSVYFMTPPLCMIILQPDTIDLSVTAAVQRPVPKCRKIHVCVWPVTTLSSHLRPTLQIFPCTSSPP